MLWTASPAGHSDDHVLAERAGSRANWIYLVGAVAFSAAVSSMALTWSTQNYMASNLSASLLMMIAAPPLCILVELVETTWDGTGGALCRDSSGATTHD